MPYFPQKLGILFRISVDITNWMHIFEYADENIISKITKNCLQTPCLLVETLTRVKVSKVIEGRLRLTQTSISVIAIKQTGC